jgi:hypothetical protein
MMMQLTTSNPLAAERRCAKMIDVNYIVFRVNYFYCILQP